MLFEVPILRTMIAEQWQGIPGRFPTVELDEFVIMPNHIHFVLWLTDASVAVGASLADAQGGGTVGDSPPLNQNDAPVVLARASLGAGASPAPTLSDVVGAFKSKVAVEWLNWVKRNRPLDSARIWQRNYYERVVRDEEELNRICEYIQTNPLKWELDRDNPDRRADTEWDKTWSWLENGEDPPNA